MSAPCGCPRGTCFEAANPRAASQRTCQRPAPAVGEVPAADARAAEVEAARDRVRAFVHAVEAYGEVVMLVATVASGGVDTPLRKSDLVLLLGDGVDR